MRRMYLSTADFRAPFDAADLQGLGKSDKRWPAGRSYWTTANFRSPYDDGYFQNTLFGVPADFDPSKDAPPLVRRYVISGEPVPTTLRDAMVPFNQVSRWVYVGTGLVALFAAYRSYKRWKKDKKGNGSSEVATASG